MSLNPFLTDFKEKVQLYEAESWPAFIFPFFLFAILYIGINQRQLGKITYTKRCDFVPLFISFSFSYRRHQIYRKSLCFEFLSWGMWSVWPDLLSCATLAVKWSLRKSRRALWQSWAWKLSQMWVLSLQTPAEKKGKQTKTDGCLWAFKLSEDPVM